MEHSNVTQLYAAVRNRDRLSINISVRVVLDDGSVSSGRGHDLGLGGMAIYVPLDLAVASAINISFQLPYSRIMFGVRAVVRNKNSFRYGVEFMKLTDFEAEEIKRITSILKLTA